MLKRPHVRSCLGFALWSLALIVGSATEVRAQGFISPLIGYDFGGDASCPQISNCEDKRLNAGVALGTMGPIFGFEEEFAYAKDFFGNASGLSSSVLTLMSNVMLVPRVGPVRPYLLAGMGLLKTHVDFSPTSLLTSDNNNFGWDVGGGMMALVAPHVGVRGDIRYFHAFQDTTILAFPVNNPKLDFGRASLAVVFTF
ncbi:MAG: porin family protein [Acidobacteria bacterium]|nr:porin family protein [Acidobacteriota bacterium]